MILGSESGCLGLENQASGAGGIAKTSFSLMLGLCRFWPELRTCDKKNSGLRPLGLNSGIKTSIATCVSPIMSARKKNKST